MSLIRPCLRCLRAAEQSTLSIGGKYHVIGGQTPDTCVEDLDTGCALKVAGSAHVAVVAHGGQIYYIGGQKNHDTNRISQNALHRTSPATNTWTALTPLPRRSSSMTGSSCLAGRPTVAEAAVANTRRADAYEE